MTTEKAKHGLVWIMLCLLLAGGPAFAKAPVNGDALLWKVTSQRGAVNYIFGTIHSDDPRVLQLKPAAQTAFAGSERLVLEIALSPEGMLDMMTRMYRRDNSTLQQDLPAPLYAQTVAAYKTRGLEESWVNR